MRLHGTGVEGGILSQHRCLQLAQPGRQLDAELIREPLPRVADRGERLDLASRTVVRHGEDRPSFLSERLGSHRLLRLRDDLAVRADVESLFEQLLLGAEADLGQAGGLPASRAPNPQVRGMPAAPQRECSAVRVDRAVVVTMERVLAGARDEPLELEGVDRAGVDAERVVRAAGEHGVVTEPSADAGNGGLHLLRPRPRGTLAPVGLRKLVR